eukprot:1159376-Pelagomonas_calceolata.AAC.8
MNTTLNSCAYLEEPTAHTSAQQRLGLLCTSQTWPAKIVKEHLRPAAKNRALQIQQQLLIHASISSLWTNKCVACCHWHQSRLTSKITSPTPYNTHTGSLFLNTRHTHKFREQRVDCSANEHRREHQLQDGQEHGFGVQGHELADLNGVSGHEMIDLQVHITTSIPYSLGVQGHELAKLQMHIARFGVNSHADVIFTAVKAPGNINV